MGLPQRNIEGVRNKIVESLVDFLRRNFVENEDGVLLRSFIYKESGSQAVAFQILQRSKLSGSGVRGVDAARRS